MMIAGLQKAQGSITQRLKYKQKKPSPPVESHHEKSIEGESIKGKYCCHMALYKNIPLLLHRDRRYLFKQILTREYAMGIDNNVALQTNTKKLAKSEPSRGIWIGGMAVRAIFIIILTVVTARVASPQVENIWSVFETPGDLIRVALGFAACAWFITHIFVLPKDAEAYRTWLYLGLAVLPLSLLCAFVIW